MDRRHILVRVVAALAVVGVVMAAYLLWARPYQLHWGATEAEIQGSMPGDELYSSPSFLATRAITIDNPPEKIWPWLIQMGFGRAGFYGYDILENIGSPRGASSADTILPDLQNPRVGDPLPLSAAGGLLFYAIEPNQYVVWSGADGWGDFAWVLSPIDAGHTRLVSRIGWTHHWTEAGPLVFDIFTEFTDHLAVRKILQGVKGRAEGRAAPPAQANLEFFTYLAAALLFLGGVVLVLVRPLTWRGWFAALASGAGWLITWYAPISIWVGMMLELFILGVLVWAASTSQLQRA
jgi:hypothetical protein